MTSLPSEAWQSRSPLYPPGCSFCEESSATMDEELLVQVQVQVLNKEVALEWIRSALLAIAKLHQDTQNARPADIPTAAPPLLSITEHLEPNQGLFLGYTVLFSESDD